MINMQGTATIVGGSIVGGSIVGGSIVGGSIVAHPYASDEEITGSYHQNNVFSLYSDTPPQLLMQ